jgi:hypothetical protein
MKKKKKREEEKKNVWTHSLGLEADYKAQFQQTQPKEEKMLGH